MIGLLAVPTLNRHDLLGKMLASVDVEVDRLLIIDNSGNGYDVPDGPWQSATVLTMPVNFGVAASWNLAIKCGFKRGWVMIASDDCWFRPGTLQQFVSKVRPDGIVTASNFPRWHAFAFGMHVAEKVGLFDERYYPAYYEDTEMTRRCSRADVPIVDSGVRVEHVNSATVKADADFLTSNRSTFASNAALFAEDTPGHWSPSRWMDNRWT